jgi:hypothetical protein
LAEVQRAIKMPRAKIERIYRNLEHGRSGDEVAPAWHASMMERMELEGIVGQANHAGKREILVEEEEGGF